MTGERCFGDGDPLLAAYHDDEWGRPVTDERGLLERLCLEGFQSGLSWRTILAKRERFRAALCDFEADALARLRPADVDRLLGDAGIVRHRGKLEAAIANARATVALRDGGGLVALVWSHRPPPSPPRTRWGELPTRTAESRALAAALRRTGFRFVGPTTAYATMQACGLVDDHLAGCPMRGAAQSPDDRTQARSVAEA